jgi:hypothetical protein
MSTKFSSSSQSFELLTVLVPRLLAVTVLALVGDSALGLPNQEEPSQRDWEYREYADVVTGAPYPAALLVSRSVIASQANPRVGLAYLSVENYAKRPMEVTFSWDSSLPWQPGTQICKPTGCELRVRFGNAKAMSFIAIQGKYGPTLALQDGRAFVATAVRYSGAIEAQIQTLDNQLLTFQFTTGSRLKVDKLKK